jgi:hypothetical protein
MTTTSWPGREEMLLALRAASAREEQATREADRAMAALKQLAARANADANPHRLGIRTIGRATGRSGMAVYEWLHGDLAGRGGVAPNRHRRGSGSGTRCHAVNTGHAGKAGQRCAVRARPGELTCWHHRNSLPRDWAGDGDGAS